MLLGVARRPPGLDSRRFWGFRSRWMMPLLCSSRTAPAICCRKSRMVSSLSVRMAEGRRAPWGAARPGAPGQQPPAPHGSRAPPCGLQARRPRRLTLSCPVSAPSLRAPRCCPAHPAPSQLRAASQQLPLPAAQGMHHGQRLCDEPQARPQRWSPTRARTLRRPAPCGEPAPAGAQDRSGPRRAADRRPGPCRAPHPQRAARGPAQE